MSTASKIHTHYDNLKVARNAPESVIRAAYKALSQQYHPDKNGGDPAASNIMRLINEAYAVLSDPARRRNHDAWIAEQEVVISAGQTRSSAPPPHPEAPPPQQMRPRAADRKQPNWWYFGFFLLLLLIILNIGSGVSNSPSSSKPIAASITGQNRQPVQNRTPETKSSVANANQSSHRGEQLPATDKVFANLLPRGRVTAPELNVRAGPNAKHDVVARLRFLDTVSVEGPADSGWIPISHRAGFGYVNGAYIQVGPDHVTLQALCGNAETPPASGTLFKRPEVSGDHELRIRSSDSADALIKLKDSGGRTVLSGYVRRGEAYTFRGIPTGRYSAWFATGGAYSAKCGRFLQDMAVTFDPTPQEFRVTQSAGLTYSTIIEYSLQRQKGGNFSASGGDMDSFIAD